MINLSIKLKASELSDFSKVIQVVRKNCLENLHEDDYFHFYNIQSLLKRCFDKQYNNFNNYKKEITLKININESKSLNILYALLIKDFNGDSLVYYQVLMQKILSDLHKKEHNLFPSQYLNLN